MAQITRQTNLLVQQDWTKIYQTFTNADFTSYDFETLRASMINYIKTYYPETFNDFIESSEYLALIDMIAFLGQSLAFRTDLNARENFIDTAQRRDSILKLARMLSYNPHRTTSASGLLKIDSVSTTESLFDSNGTNLSNAITHWNDLTNDNWLEQFTTIVNASLVTSETIGKPGNSQKINNIQTDEYSISLDPNTLPVARFSSRLQDTAVIFEAVSATTVGQSYIYEDDPTKSGQFNILYRNDNNGNGSNNTGFFVYFKQGTLNNTQFDITNVIPNNYASIATNNITNSDFWLYALDVNNIPQTKWTSVPALSGINVIFNNSTEKNLYQVNTKNLDQVDLVFGDGNFANMPRGKFMFFYRTANGTTYSITPDDMASVNIAFSYVSKNNTLETLSVTASLKYTVTNANAAPSSASIKNLAPQQYYTQNRMITGEDYNIFPYTNFDSIQKLKAVNRTSSGVSQYLDQIDPTGSYSSTNIFGDDGIISNVANVAQTTFTFVNTNDIYTAIYNKIIPIINSTEMRNYYYAIYPRYNSIYSNVTFKQVGNTTVSSTGYLTYGNIANIQPIGTGINGNLKYVASGASLRFSSPAGQYFDSDHVLQTGNATNTNDSITFSAAVTNTISSGNFTTPNLITFGTYVPTGAILSNIGLIGQNCIIPVYKNDLTASLVTTIVAQIQARVNFGLTYDQVNQVWINISPGDIGSSTNWLLRFSLTQGTYYVDYKIIKYIFGSASSTGFYFDPITRVYNSSTGSVITDSVKILKINTKPNSADALGVDVPWQIYNTITEADGYIDTGNVLIKSKSTQMENVPDDPDLYSVAADGLATRTDLYFQYKHNSPARSRIDPTPINIIDLYILTSAYTSSYLNWLRDLTGKVVEPIALTATSLETAYGTLDNYKAVSDSIVYNSAKFKPLFGAKANESLRARFQVVKNMSTGMTDNEIKTQVISAINTYFDPSNWDFGDKFYFSELAAYLHSTLAPNISSVLIIPANNTLVFGNYFQINSEPWEIITSAATINDIDIVSAVTAAQLNLGNPLQGTF